MSNIIWVGVWLLVDMPTAVVRPLLTSAMGMSANNPTTASVKLLLYNSSITNECCFKTSNRFFKISVNFSSAPQNISKLCVVHFKATQQLINGLGVQLCACGHACFLVFLVWRFLWRDPPTALLVWMNGTFTLVNSMETEEWLLEVKSHT